MHLNACSSVIGIYVLGCSAFLEKVPADILEEGIMEGFLSGTVTVVITLIMISILLSAH
jgi:hypothetical protein